MSDIVLSVLVPIYGTPVRNELFSCGLKTLVNQTFPRENWELIILDDETPAENDVKRVFEPYIGKINIRHIRVNHRKHWVWRELNPNGLIPGEPERWYHSQGLTLNIGFKNCNGQCMAITQPEVLHEATNLQYGLERAFAANQMVFSSMVLSGFNFNLQLFRHPDMSFDEMWQKACSSVYFDEVGEVKPVPIFMENELYWYIAFFNKNAAFAVHGVEERTLLGVYADDDMFKCCLQLAGYIPVWDGRIRGIHLNHCAERHYRQRRESTFWDEGAARNRQDYFEWGNVWFRAMRGEIPKEPVYTCNVGRDWGSSDCIEQITDYFI